MSTNDFHAKFQHYCDLTENMQRNDYAVSTAVARAAKKYAHVLGRLEGLKAMPSPDQNLIDACYAILMETHEELMQAIRADI